MGQLIISRGSGEDVGEGHITIVPHAFDSVTKGDWILSTNTSQVLNGFIANSGGSPAAADLDRINYKVFLAKGTYTVSILTVNNTDEAILDLLIDGVSKGTSDNFSASLIFNVITNFTGIVITTSGLVELSIKVNGRNVSSSNWVIAFSSISLYRTA